MKTKQKILKAALALFNERGLMDTTIRNIAQELNMSSGNLNYHFRYKEEIIEDLYFELMDRVVQRIDELEEEHIDLALFYKIISAVKLCMYEYRFLYRSLFKILSDNLKIQKHYLQMSKERSDIFITLLKHWQENNIIRQPEFKDEYKRLHKRIVIIREGWINNLDLIDMSQEEGIAYFSDLIFEILYPYLTKKGKKEYHEIISN